METEASKLASEVGDEAGLEADVALLEAENAAVRQEIDEVRITNSLEIVSSCIMELPPIGKKLFRDLHLLPADLCFYYNLPRFEHGTAKFELLTLCFAQPSCYWKVFKSISSLRWENFHLFFGGEIDLSENIPTI